MSPPETLQDLAQRLGTGAPLTGDPAMGRGKPKIDRPSRGHRLIAASALGLTDVPPEVRTGTRTPLPRGVPERPGLGGAPGGLGA